MFPGRVETADIVLNTKIVSRRHCIIEFVDGKMYIVNDQVRIVKFLNLLHVSQKISLKGNKWNVSERRKDPTKNRG